MLTMRNKIKKEVRLCEICECEFRINKKSPVLYCKDCLPEAKERNEECQEYLRYDNDNPEECRDVEDVMDDLFRNIEEYPE